MNTTSLNKLFVIDIETVPQFPDYTMLNNGMAEALVAKNSENYTRNHYAGRQLPAESRHYWLSLERLFAFQLAAFTKEKANGFSVLKAFITMMKKFCCRNL